MWSGKAEHKAQPQELENDRVEKSGPLQGQGVERAGTALLAGFALGQGVGCGHQPADVPLFSQCQSHPWNATSATKCGFALYLLHL